MLNCVKILTTSFYFFILISFAISTETNKKSEPKPKFELCGFYGVNSTVAGVFDVPFIMGRDKGPSWAVIQRREDEEDFNKNWETYVDGFGNLDGSFFLGLEKIQAFTNSEPYELWIEIGDKDGETRYAHYDSFTIGDANNNYALKLGKYQGNANDGMQEHNGLSFSTFDKDNDNAEGNCGDYYDGGWWFDECYQSFLNGIYTNNTGSEFGIHWNGDHSVSYSYVHMAIRPVSVAPIK